MTDFEIPELPSDEELGIADAEDEPGSGDSPATPQAPPSGKEPGDAGPPTKDAGPPGPPAARPGRPWLGPLTLALLAGLTFATSSARVLPEPVPSAAPDTVFSSERAMTELAGIARRPHPTGSPEHARVRALVLDRLRALGLEPEVQTATSMVRRGSTVVAATVRNVLARVPGSASTGAVLLMAHYDSELLSPGGGDDGSGVATILEAVRAVRASAGLRNDLILLFTDAEELGLLGARAFVAEHPWMQDVAVAINMEMRGGGGPSIMFETGEESGWIVGALAAGDPRPFGYSLSHEVYRRLPNDTDFTPFRERGVQGLNFAAIGRGRIYHQPFDSPEHVAEATVQHHGLNLLGMVRELGGRRLTDVDAPDVVYFYLPVLGLVTYPPAWGYVLPGLLVAVTVLVLLLVRRAGGRMPGVAAGAGIAVLSVAAGAGAGWALLRRVRGYHPEYGALQGSAFHEEGWYVLALVGVSLAVTTGLLSLARRRFRNASLALGAALLPMLAACVLTFAAPLAGPSLQWPALLALIGAAIAAMDRGPGAGLVSRLLLLPIGAAILAFWTPLVELLWLSLTLDAAPVIGGLVALGFVLLLPLLDALREPVAWWATALGALAAGVFVAVGIARAGPTADRPAPSTLLYALDHDSTRAVWASHPDAGLGWAQGRVGALTGTMDPALFALPRGPGYRSRTVAPATSVELSPPQVSAVVVRADEAAAAGAVGDTGAPGPDGEADTAPTGTADATPGEEPGPGARRRTVSVRIRSVIGAEMVAVRLPESADAFLRRVNGRELPAVPASQRSGTARATRVAHFGVPVDGAVDIELDVGPDLDSMRLVVIEHHLRPGELVGDRWFLRPPHLAPNITTDSDRAVTRIGVSLPLDTDAR